MTWQADLARAIRLNVDDDDVRAIVHRPALGTSVGHALAVAEHVIRSTVTYRFLGEAHPIAPWSTVSARGWGACADATAVLVAVAVLVGAHDVALLYESDPTRPGYAHVRMVADGYLGDAFRDRRWDLDDAARVPLSDLMGPRWRAGVDALEAARARR